MRLRLSVFLVVGAEVPAAVLRPAVLRDERVLFLRRGLVLAPVVASVEHELAVLDQRVCVLVAGLVQLYRHANSSSSSRGALGVPSGLAGYHYSSEGSRLRAGSPLSGAGGVVRRRGAAPWRRPQTCPRRWSEAVSELFTRSPASASTSPRIPTISSNCSCLATSGGEIWITGSPRSSARQIRPRSNSALERKSRSSHSHSASVNVSRVSLSLTSSSA